MNRRDFLKVASAGFGTLLVSGLGFSLLTKPTESTSAAAAAPVNATPVAQRAKVLPNSVQLHALAKSGRSLG